MKYQRATLPELVLGALADYPLTRVDVGDEATMKKNGFHFQTEAYEAEGLGHICFLTMKAMGGLMKMETAVLATTAKFQAIKDKDADLADRETDPHWYDDILLPQSYDKTGKKISERLNKAAAAYLEEYIAQVRAAPDCDPVAKKENVRHFAQTLFDQGGPAVDQVTKLFGKETAERLILGHMYGVK